MTYYLTRERIRILKAEEIRQVERRDISTRASGWGNGVIWGKGIQTLKSDRVEFAFQFHCFLIVHSWESYLVSVSLTICWGYQENVGKLTSLTTIC